LTIALAIGVLVIIGGLFQQSPYCRFGSTAPGVNLNPKLGWWLMEIPATAVFAIFYLTGPHRLDATPLVLAAI